jgi:phosphosulfolactate phosphohydrolase-like enzyme
VGAKKILAACFLNLSATAEFIVRAKPSHLVIVCAGTHERTALEDALAAGALCEQLDTSLSGCVFLDSAQIARGNFLAVSKILATALRASENARRLLTIPDLQADVNYCLQRDICPIVAGMGEDAALRKL